MFQKRKRQMLLPLNTLEAAAGRRANLGYLVHAKIGKLLPLHIPEKHFDGIEIGRIAGQTFDAQPVALAPQEYLHLGALVSGKSVPYQRDHRSAKMLFKFLNKLGQTWRIKIPWSEAEIESRAFSVPTIRKSGAHRHLLPVERVVQDWCFSLGCPRFADRWLLCKTGFIEEQEPATGSSAVFFSAGQRSQTHCRTAASFLSRARLAGFCKVQFNDLRILQTCPG